MNIIAIECSTNICSVASFKDNSLINVIESDEAFSHSKNLPLMFKSIVCDFNDYKEDIDFFAISIGPGSFTSLRISLSFIKGFAFGLNSKIVPVPTLESLNLLVKDQGEHYVVVDSYRDKCFVQEFNGAKIANEPYIDSVSNLANIKSEIYGYSKSIQDSCKIIPSAILIGQYAIKNSYDLIQKNNIDDISPIYLSDSKYVKINDIRSK